MFQNFCRRAFSTTPIGVTTGWVSVLHNCLMCLDLLFAAADVQLSLKKYLKTFHDHVFATSVSSPISTMESLH